MKKTILSMCIVFLLSFFAFHFIACSPNPTIKSISVEEQSLVLSVGDFEFVDYTLYADGYSDSEDYNSVEWSSSNKNIAIISYISDARFYDNIGDGFLSIEAKNIGNCTITLKADNISTNINISVLLDPQINVYQRENNSFQILSYLPNGTKMKISLTGNNYTNNQDIILQKYSETKSEAIVTFISNEQKLDGIYQLTIKLCDISLQPDNVKKIIGNNGENLIGNDIQDLNNGKTVQFAKNFELPYKTELEKIQETTYSKLTKKQMLSIISWIEDRYDYYDKQAGYYTGDKYTKTIFNEAASRYNKSYFEISAIWDRSYELKYGN